MHHYRRVCKPASRSTFRQATRPVTRVRWHAPDDLGTALTCFRHAIRAHRRLARLAPRFFDSTLLNRELREQEARRQWSELCNAALRKVYGTAPAPPRPIPGLPPLPRARTQLAVELELFSCRAWLALGGDALRRFRVRHPHACVDFSRLAGLVELAATLGRLATGADSAQPRDWSDRRNVGGQNAAPQGACEVASPVPAHSPETKIAYVNQHL